MKIDKLNNRHILADEGKVLRRGEECGQDRRRARAAQAQADEGCRAHGSDG